MKHLQTFNESVSRSELITFILDFGMFISMNLSKVNDFATDGNKQKLEEMMMNVRKSLINGKSYSQITMDVEMMKDHKILHGLLTQIKSLLEFIEPRIKQFVIEGEKKATWLNKLTQLKERYIKIVQ